MRVEPVTPAGLVAHVVRRLEDAGQGERLRVVVDGAPPTGTGALADALVGPLRAGGRPVVRVHARDFLRPASVRLEHGHEDEQAFYEDWLDVDGLDREVLRPFGPGGSGAYLPALRDPLTDRSTRAPRVQTEPGTVLVLDGALLLGRDLVVELTVHLALRPDTLARLTPDAERWTLPAYGRYAREVDLQAVADVLVRVDDPRRPALVHR